MKQDIPGLKNRAQKELKEAQTLKELEEVYRAYLGRKGELTQILRSLKDLSAKKRGAVGKAANEARSALGKAAESRRAELLEKETRAQEEAERIDVTAPGVRISPGRLHPLTRTLRRAQEIFRDMGFGIAEGPDMEKEWYNFDALNMPPNHPARDMWDTFWLKPKKAGLLLRTHTSPVQIRYMEEHDSPFRIIAPGKVFRYEATDARHGFELSQIEGLMVGKEVSVANFKAVIAHFYQRFFGKEVTIRLRPSYFPFVEPGFEVDMSCVFCSGKSACASCGGSGWMEMMGAGMVHPAVFKAVGYAPQAQQGFAFGMGTDRLAMMKYKIPDIRLLYSGDIRVLEQF